MLLLFAVLLLLFPRFFTEVALFSTGIILLLFSVTQITAIIRFRKVIPIGLPWFIYLNPVAVFILSLIIMLNPFDTAKMLAVFAGIICLVYAVTEIVQAVTTYRLVKSR